METHANLCLSSYVLVQFALSELNGDLLVWIFSNSAHVKLLTQCNVLLTTQCDAMFY